MNITKYVASSNQLADIFTEPLGKDKFSTILVKLGVLGIHSPTWGKCWEVNNNPKILDLYNIIVEW